MAQPSKENLIITRGDDKVYVLKCTNAAGEPVDMSGYTFIMTCKKSYDDSDEDAVFQRIVDANDDDAAQGVIKIHITHEDTWQSPASYLYDIQMYSGETFVSTLQAGKYKIIRGVTNKPHED